MLNRISGNHGFTLIELLAVVLIIGILASIAWPQYQKAVIKSRVGEALAVLKTIAQADKICRLNKSGLCKIEDLDITPPGNCSDGMVCWADHMVYTASSGFGNLDEVNATAAITNIPGDLCLCYLTDDRIVLRQDGSGCGSANGTIDYSELLDIPEDTAGICSCC